MSALPNPRKSHGSGMKKTSLAHAARSAPGTTPNKMAHGSRKSSKKPKRADDVGEEPNVSEDEGLMASAFPHYCDRCGIQMFSANASYTLYCSDRCSRGDNDGRFSLSARASTSSSLSHSHCQVLDQSNTATKRYVPEAKPTSVPASPFSRIPPYHHAIDRDLDPTEWKPAEGDQSHGPKKRITLNNPFDFSQGYTEHLSQPIQAEGRTQRADGIHAASMPDRKPARYGNAMTLGRDIMRHVPSLSRASTTTASSSLSSTGSYLCEEVNSFVPATLSPKAGVANISISHTPLVDEIGSMSLEQSKGLYDKHPVAASKPAGHAQGSLKKLLGGKS